MRVVMAASAVCGSGHERSLCELPRASRTYCQSTGGEHKGYASRIQSTGILGSEVPVHEGLQRSAGGSFQGVDFGGLGKSKGRIKLRPSLGDLTYRRYSRPKPRMKARKLNTRAIRSARIAYSSLPERTGRLVLSANQTTQRFEPRFLVGRRQRWISDEMPVELADTKAHR